MVTVTIRENPALFECWASGRQGFMVLNVKTAFSSNCVNNRFFAKKIKLTDSEYTL